VSAHPRVPARPRHGGPGPDLPAGTRLAGPEVLEDPRYRAAISTPWRDRVVASALRRNDGCPACATRSAPKLGAGESGQAAGDLSAEPHPGAGRAAAARAVPVLPARHRRPPLVPAGMRGPRTVDPDILARVKVALERL
jgi:hypothetical protein